jgi:hypothetical protein
MSQRDEYFHTLSSTLPLEPTCQSQSEGWKTRLINTKCVIGAGKMCRKKNEIMPLPKAKESAKLPTARDMAYHSIVCGEKVCL